jgi:hypothetical protein
LLRQLRVVVVAFDSNSQEGVPFISHRQRHHLFHFLDEVHDHFLFLCEEKAIVNIYQTDDTQLFVDPQTGIDGFVMTRTHKMFSVLEQDRRVIVAASARILLSQTHGE